MKSKQGPQPTAIVPIPTGYTPLSSAYWPITAGAEDGNSTAFLIGQWYKMALFLLPMDGQSVISIGYKVAVNTRTLDANIGVGIWDYLTGELVFWTSDTLPAGVTPNRNASFGGAVKVPRIFYLGLSLESIENGTLLELATCYSGGGLPGIVGGSVAPAVNMHAVFFSGTHASPGALSTALLFASMDNISCRAAIEQ